MHKKTNLAKNTKEYKVFKTLGNLLYKQKLAASMTVFFTSPKPNNFLNSWLIFIIFFHQIVQQ